MKEGVGRRDEYRHGGKEPGVTRGTAITSQRTVGQLRSAFDNNTTLRSLVSRNMTLNEWTQSWEMP